MNAWNEKGVGKRIRMNGRKKKKRIEKKNTKKKKNKKKAKRTPWKMKTTKSMRLHTEWETGL